MKLWPSSDTDQILRQGISLLPNLVADLPHKSAVTKVALSPDARDLVTVSDGRVFVWELPDGSGGSQPGRERNAVSHESAALTVAISPNGKYLLTGGLDGEVRIIEFPSGRSLLGRMEIEAKITDILPTPDSRYFITRSSSPTVFVGQRPDGRKIGSLPHEDRVISLSMSHDGTRLCTGTEKGDVSLWNWRSRRCCADSQLLARSRV